MNSPSNGKNNLDRDYFVYFSASDQCEVVLVECVSCGKPFREEAVVFFENLGSGVSPLCLACDPAATGDQLGFIIVLK